MHKDFYASGFLYLPYSQQILLQEITQEIPSTHSPWYMFGDKGRAKEQPEKAFRRIIFDSLKVKLPIQSIHPVYDYFHKSYNATHFVFYGEVEETQKLSVPKGRTL